MKIMKKTLVASALAASAFFAVGSASAGVISLTNPGFESGDLTGWTSIGSVSATPSTTVTTFDGTVWTISASGGFMAQLNSSGASVTEIETFLGLTSGSLNPLNANPSGGSLTNGSAISQGFSGNIGDTLSLYWDYVATDYIPYNDPSFAVVIAPDLTASITVLASIHGLGQNVGTSGHSGWQLFDYTLAQTGNHTLGFVTMNDKDQILNSVLFVDNAAGSCVPNCPPPVNGVPEPASLTLLGLGLVGLAAARRRKQAA